jgi:hypothetical protein
MGCYPSTVLRPIPLAGGNDKAVGEVATRAAVSAGAEVRRYYLRVSTTIHITDVK